MDETSANESFFVDLGRAIKAERMRQDLTQQDLANRVGLSKSYISHVEVARRHPTRAALTAIAHELGMSLPELVAQAGRPTTERLWNDVRTSTLAVGAAVSPILSSFFKGSALDALRFRQVLARSRPQLPDWLSDGSQPLDLTRAGDVLDSPDAGQLLADQATDHLDRIREELGEDIAATTAAMIDLLRAYASGAYQACRREVAVLIAAALTYLTHPNDALPDLVASVGLYDDLGVLVFTAELAASELRKFEQWASPAEEQ